MTDWRDGYAAACHARPAELQALADFCEGLGKDEQHRGFERVLAALIDAALAPLGEAGLVAEDRLHIGLLADSGAYESAALALLPRRASFTGGRMADGSHTAQVILPSGAGAHSRQAQSMAMAWIAALLRALAREMVERKLSSTVA